MIDPGVNVGVKRAVHLADPLIPDEGVRRPDVLHLLAQKDHAAVAGVGESGVVELLAERQLNPEALERQISWISYFFSNLSNELNG